jgi:hypothetical protein
MFCLLWLIAFGFLLYFRAVELRAKRKPAGVTNRLSLWW